MKFNRIFGGYQVGMDGLGHFVENQIEYLATDETNDCFIPINQLSEADYETLVHDLVEDLLEDDQFWEDFDSLVTYYAEQRLKK